MRTKILFDFFLNGGGMGHSVTSLGLSTTRDDTGEIDRDRFRFVSDDSRKKHEGCLWDDVVCLARDRAWRV